MSLSAAKLEVSLRKARGRNTMPDTLSVEEARRHLGDLVTKAAAEGTVTVVTKHGLPAAAIVPPQQVESVREPAWTIDDLWHELSRWRNEMESTTNEAGQHYPASTVNTHIGHSEQFVRWLGGIWRPTGPRIR
jgi:prevent-host-death family protein